MAEQDKGFYWVHYLDGEDVTVAEVTGWGVFIVGVEEAVGESQIKIISKITPPVDPRDDDPSRTGIFKSHNCAYCSDGAKPCRKGSPSVCDYPRARND